MSVCLLESQTNVTIVDMHRELFDYEPPIQLSDFKNYLYWHNYGWGSPQETLDMVRKLYASGLFTRTPLVEGAKEALWKLKDRGWRLIIITARSESQREGTEAWLADNLPDGKSPPPPLSSECRLLIDSQCSTKFTSREHSHILNLRRRRKRAI